MSISKYFYILFFSTLGCEPEVFIESGDTISLSADLQKIKVPFFKAVAEVNKALPALKLKATFHEYGDWNIDLDNSIQKSSLTKYSEPLIFVNLNKWENWVLTNEWLEDKDEGLQNITYVMFMHELWHGLGFRDPEHLPTGFMKSQITIEDNCITQMAVDILCDKRPEICGGNVNTTCEQ